MIPGPAGPVASEQEKLVGTTCPRSKVWPSPGALIVAEGGPITGCWLPAAARVILGLKLLSPPYWAVIEWLPALKLEVVNVAVSCDRVPVPMVVAPSRNVTVPVGVPAPGAVGVTVAVNVTACPRTAGSGALVRLVAVSALSTTWGLPVSDPLSPLKFVSPV